jgi:trk system potassium uptake protein TrkH
VAKFPRKITGPSAILVGSFGGLIILGTGLLSLPIMQAGQPVSLLDCLFTATSAVCVTGLITVDTATAWSGWGQALICLLFQLGGLGIMTFSVAMLHLVGRKPGLSSHLALSGSLGAAPAEEMGRLTRNIIFYTFLLEAIGAIALSLHFADRFPWDKAAALGVFHAVSAFCNAGFSLFTNSLESYDHDPFINLIIMTLIVLGGLGFLVLRELTIRFGRRKEGRPPRLSLHARMVLTTSGILVVGGALILWFLETWTGGDPGFGMWSAWFTSITARTAGFDTVAMSKLSNASLLLVIVFMFIGASPGSTGGGVKTTALASLFAMARTRLKGLGGAGLYRRSISDKQVGEALALVLCSILVIIVGLVLLTVFEGEGAVQGHARANVLAYIFEAVSAFGTVGLSMGITSSLSAGGKLVLIALMFLGRLGPLTFVFALVSRSRAPKYQPASERIMLG